MWLAAMSVSISVCVSYVSSKAVRVGIREAACVQLDTQDCTVYQGDDITARQKTTGRNEARPGLANAGQFELPCHVGCA